MPNPPTWQLKRSQLLLVSLFTFFVLFTQPGPIRMIRSRCLKTLFTD